MKDIFRRDLLKLGGGGALLLGLTGCLPPAPPPPPPLSGNGTPAEMLLTVSDVLTLQALYERTVWLESLASLASTHSGSALVRTLGQQVTDAYKTLRAKTGALAKSSDLTLSDALSKNDQTRLSRVTRLYGVAYDRAFEQALTQPEPRNLAQALSKAATAGPLKAIAAEALQLQATYSQEARAIRAAGAAACASVKE